MDDVSLDAALWRLLEAFELDPLKTTICYFGIAVHPSLDVSVTLHTGEPGVVKRIDGVLSPRVAHQLLLSDGTSVRCDCAAAEDHGPS